MFVLISVILAGAIFALLGYFKDSGGQNPSQSFENINYSKERQAWGKEIDKIGAEKTYSDIKARYLSASFSVQHTITHLFGEVLYEKMGINGFTVCDGTYSFGCFHGHFLKAMAEKGSPIVKELDDACLAKYRDEGTIAGCRHGIGHGLMEYFGNDLDSALKGCESVSEENFRFGCSAGVFMEYYVPLIFSGTSANTEPRPINGSPYSRCGSVDKKFVYSCYFELPQWWMTVIGPEYAKMGSFCAGVKTDSDREACFRGLGFFMAPGNNYDPSSTRDACDSSAAGKNLLNCRIGASFGFLVQDDKADISGQLCDGLLSSDKKYCLENFDLFKEI